MYKENGQPENGTSSRTTYYDDAETPDRRSVVYEYLEFDNQPNEPVERYAQVQESSRQGQLLEITNGKVIIGGSVFLLIVATQILTLSMVGYLMYRDKNPSIRSQIQFQDLKDPTEEFRKDIEEISRQINSSQLEIAAMKDSVENTRERLDDLLRMPVNSSGRELLVVKAHLKPNIAFLARTLTTRSPGRHTKLIFVRTVVNTDTVYNVTSGDFVAPINGTYWFSVQICGEYNSFINFRIFVNDVMFSDSSNRNTDYGICTSSNTLSILKKGDKVNVYTGWNTNRGNSISLDPSRWNMFMGALIN